MGNPTKASERPTGSRADEEPSGVPLSVCVITLNEEDNIRRCLTSVQWADEIVVVDSGSEDRTCEIAEEMGARVLHNEWPGHREQKQYATDRASHDWVLSLDADEKLDDELARSVRSVFEGSPPDPDVCYEVNRLAEYLGEWMHHGTWHPDWIVRLFNRTRTEWGGRNPHDRVLPTEEVQRLDGLLLHWPYDGIADQVDRLNRYTSISAREMHRKGESGGLLKGILHGGWLGAKYLALKGGILDGKRGMINATINAFSTYLKYLKLDEYSWAKTSEEVSRTNGLTSSIPFLHWSGRRDLHPGNTNVLYVRRRYFGASHSWSLYHRYRDIYRYYRPRGYFFRFKGLEGFFRASLHRMASVTERPFSYLRNNAGQLDDQFEAIVINAIKKETDDFYTYDPEEISVVETIDLPKLLFVPTDAPGEMPGDQTLDRFRVVYKREPFRDRSRYSIRPENQKKIHPTMLACPLYEPERYSLETHSPQDVGYREPADQYDHDVFFSGNNTSRLREELVHRLVQSPFDFVGGLQYRDHPGRLDVRHPHKKLRGERYYQAMRNARINLALEGHGAFTFRHLENWFLANFVVSSPSLRELELPMDHREGEHYVCFESKEDLMETIDYYLRHDDERRAIARQGRRLVEEEYDLDSHGSDILASLHGDTGVPVMGSSG